MATVITLDSLRFKGRVLTIEGSADFGGETATLGYQLIPLPSGKPLPALPLTLTNGKFINDNIPLGNGRWKVRLMASPPSGAVEVISPELSVNRVKGRVVLPMGGGELADSPPDPKTLSIADALMRSLYSGAIASASLGNKRAAGANAIMSQMGTLLRLDIIRNRRLIIRAEYDKALKVNVSGGDVFLTLQSQTSAVIYESAELETGNWTFELQGGPNYSRSITGRVGPGNPSDHLVLSASPIEKAGLDAAFSIVMPRSVDGL